MRPDRRSCHREIRGRSRGRQTKRRPADGPPRSFELGILGIVYDLVTAEIRPGPVKHIIGVEVGFAGAVEGRRKSREVRNDEPDWRRDHDISRAYLFEPDAAGEAVGDPGVVDACGSLRHLPYYRSTVRVHSVVPVAHVDMGTVGRDLVLRLAPLIGLGHDAVCTGCAQAGDTQNANGQYEQTYRSTPRLLTAPGSLMRAAGRLITYERPNESHARRLTAATSVPDLFPGPAPEAGQ